MKTFDDLKFRKTKSKDGFEKRQARLNLGNGIIFIAVGGEKFRGDGITTFEISAVYEDGKENVTLEGRNGQCDIISWAEKEMIDEQLKRLQEPKKENSEFFSRWGFKRF